jgi:hypothetical protein
MRVLFLHSGTQDYLAESLFHGLRSLLGAACVDVPRYDSMYRTLTAEQRLRLRGRGFTLYGLLPELPELEAARAHWEGELDLYDHVVVASVWRQWPLLLDSRLRGRELVLVDGEDWPTVFPYTRGMLRAPRAFLAGASRHPYFKRELFGGAADYGGLAGWLPSFLRRALPKPTLLPVAFAVPAEKVRDVPGSAKTKDFPRHLVDPDLARRVAGAVGSSVGSDRYVFDTEEEYRDDLGQSRFGVTTKRAGWDCLRHYELAANGCVLCFKDLDQKPATCAPHGLGRENCIIYRTPEELLARVQSLPPEEYRRMQEATRRWVGTNTTEARARQFLAALQERGAPPAANRQP